MSSSDTTVTFEQRLFLRLRLSSDSDTSQESKPSYFAIEEQRLWFNAKVIKYCFVQNVTDESSSTAESEAGTEAETNKYEVIPYSTSDLSLLAKMDYVASAMRVYEQYANIKFELTGQPDQSDIRISFDGGSTSCWSTIGTDALLVPSPEPTADLGAINSPAPQDGDDDTTYSAIALHAVGHMLGFFQELESGSVGAMNSNGDLAAREGHGMTNFREYDEDSAMRNFVPQYPDGTVSSDINESLSNNDKAWLSLHYPKPELNRPVDADTWTYKKSLGQLLSTDADIQAFLGCGDVAERRSLYYEFIHKEWQNPPSGKKSYADATFNKNILDSVKSALDEYKKDPNGWVDFIAEDRTLWDSQNVNSAPKPVPAWMPDKTPLDAIRIQNSLADLLRLLGRAPAPAVQHFLTYRPEDPVFVNWQNTLRTRQRALEDKLTTDQSNKDIQDELDSIVGLLESIGSKTPVQVKALAETGLDKLLQSVEQSIPQGADVTAADVRQFFPWIPVIVTGVQIILPLLGLSIDADGKAAPSADVQQGIWGDIWGEVKKVPWEDIVDLATKIVKGVQEK